MSEFEFSLHLEAMAWLRYGKQMSYVASEVGRFNADVLGYDGKNLFEIEVKKSRADFRNDFRKPKHDIYREKSGSYWVPHFYYFFVPESLKQAGLEILAEQESPAGLAVLGTPTKGVYGYNKRSVTIARRAPRIHDKEVSPKVLALFAKRMASDLTTTRLLLEQQAASDCHREMVRDLVATPDWENVDEKNVEQVSPDARDDKGENRDSGRPGTIRDAGTEAPEILPPPNCS